jgi:hypothetical protein
MTGIRTAGPGPSRTRCSARLEAVGWPRGCFTGRPGPSGRCRGQARPARSARHQARRRCGRRLGTPGPPCARQQRYRSRTGNWYVGPSSAAAGPPCPAGPARPRPDPGAGRQARAAVHILSIGPGCTGKHRRLGQPLARWPGRPPRCGPYAAPAPGIPPTAFRPAPLSRPGNVNQRDKRPRPPAHSTHTPVMNGHNAGVPVMRWVRNDVAVDVDDGNRDGTFCLNDSASTRSAIFFAMVSRSMLVCFPFRN